MEPDEAVVGATGVLLIGTRGAQGPGEVLAQVRGGTETFFAWSADALATGTRVLVVESRGGRQVDVIEWADPLDALAGEAGDAG